MGIYYIGYYVGLHCDNGKENGNYYRDYIYGYVIYELITCNYHSEFVQCFM